MVEKGSGGEIPVLVRALEQALEKKSWHGTNLKGSLRGVPAAQAAWRPAPGRHNVWEIAVHTAYWKYAVTRRIRGGKKGSFPLGGSNWIVRPEGEPDEKAWREDLQLLVTLHRELIETVSGLSESDLGQVPPGSRTTILDTVLGVAAHDLYHCGQIQLLKRLSGF